VAGLFCFSFFPKMELIGAAAIGLGVLCVLAPNPVLGLFFMLGAVVNGLFLLLAAGESLMVFIFLTVYVGAISILFLFVAIFVNPESPRLRFTALFPIMSLVFLFILFGVELLLAPFNLSRLSLDSGFAFLDFVDLIGFHPFFYQFGGLLFGQFFFSTFMVGLILFASMIGAIALSLTPMPSRIDLQSP
jgi:NADH:ubiquinone oxidoreductase subunit 6 (subunit J)